MLIHEFNFLSPFALNFGWQEIIDTTSVAGYTFYGLAPYTASGTKPDQTKAVWFIYVLNNTTGITSYYPPNQTWSTRSSSLPGGLP